jgi:hypothetical protein
MIQMDRDSVLGEWERQIQTFIELGYHKALGMTEGQYRRSFHEPRAPLDAWGGKFDRLLVIENRLPWWRKFIWMGQRELRPQRPSAGIRLYKEFVVPANNYTLWFQDGSVYANTPPRDVAGTLFAPFERGLSITEGFDLYANYPEIFQRQDEGWTLPCAVALVGAEHQPRGIPIISYSALGVPMVYWKEAGRPHIWVPSCGIWRIP